MLLITVVDTLFQQMWNQNSDNQKKRTCLYCLSFFNLFSSKKIGKLVKGIREFSCYIVPTLANFRETITYSIKIEVQIFYCQGLLSSGTSESLLYT